VRARSTDGRIREKDVVGDLAHDFCLARGRAGQPDCAASNLLGGDARRLVRLDVRPQGEPVLGSVRSCAVEIAFHPIEVDDRCRCLEGVQSHHGLVRVGL
jgi:hypothetical protein